jgi:outer membrane lipoprotein-sorting protein
VSGFRSRPVLRWLVPTTAAAVVIGGGAAAGIVVASADPTLPERSAAQLLVDLQGARVDGFSGTVVQTADLGLQKVPGLNGSGQQGGVDIAGMITGNNTVRIWYAGEDKVRLALLGVLGETDMIRNGSDVWIWRSAQGTATHMKIPAGEKTPQAAPAPLPSTPQEAADAALAAIDPTTAVSTTGAAEVAGRDAYELVLQPRDTDSLIGQVRLAIDAEHHIPLRVDVYAKNATDPAVRVAFQQISFTVPDAEQFTFNPPPGTKVQNESPRELHDKAQAESQKKAEALKPQKGAAEPKSNVIGKGWTSIFVADRPKAKGTEGQAIDGLIEGLPKVSGSWGSGRLFAGTLFSVLVTDDGRVLAGAVAPEKLYQAAAK